MIIIPIFALQHVYEPGQRNVITDNNGIIREWVRLYADSMYAWAYTRLRTRYSRNLVTRCFFGQPYNHLINLKNKVSLNLALFHLEYKRSQINFRKQFHNPVNIPGLWNFPLF